ncbi:MerR family transcriptional regulator [uncultured Thalassolituus sp.]|uniref:MerR family transcriptional regulator n=1 Tax=uncultured Thalassolituus sp. TaxID=285273 RepID=UPI002626397D|nr:MerR family transcriptional regulator [uncultured Thalassolituus sp.]
MSATLSIGELSKRSGLAASKIRFYESIGLLRMVKRKANGYREYPPEAAIALSLITTAQKAGFSLDELKGLMPADLDHWDHDALVESLETKLKEVETLIASLEVSRAELKKVLGQLNARPDDITCTDNARRMINEHMSQATNTQIVK